MSSLMQWYEKKMTEISDSQIVFKQTFNVCSSWLNDVQSINDAHEMEHILHHRLSGFSGHIFYVHTILNGIEKCYRNKIGRVISSIIWGKWECLRSLFVTKENIIGEFSLSLDKPYKIQTKKTDFCFVVSMENYLKVLIPIINSLIANDKNVAVITIYDARSWDAVNKVSDKVDWIYLEESILESDKKHYEENIKILRKKWYKDRIIIKKNIKKSSAFVFLAVKRRIQVIYLLMFPRVFLYETVFARLLEQLHPQELIAVRLRRAFDICGVEVAKEKGIKTSLIIHGQIFSNYKFYESDGFFDTDTIYTWGKFQEEIIKSKQKYFSTGKCKNFGNPLWDKLFRDYQVERKFAPERGNANQRILLYMGQSDSFSFFEKFIMALGKIDNTLLVVKPHPYENSTSYKNVADKYQIEAEIIDANYNDIDVLIRKSDIAYTYTSTTGINIMLNQIPLVTLNFNKESDIFLTEKIPTSPIAESIEELFFITKNILDDNEYREKIIKDQQEFIEQRLECGGMAVNKIVCDLLRKNG